MDLEEKIQTDMKAAMKSGEKVALETLRMLRSQLKNASIAKGEALSGDDVIAVLTKEAKKRKESLEAYEKGGRTDLVEREGRELEIIQFYLPEALLTLFAALGVMPKGKGTGTGVHVCLRMHLNDAV